MDPSKRSGASQSRSRRNSPDVVPSCSRSKKRRLISEAPVDTDESCLRPSPAQLRQLWKLDNHYASQYMGAPFRACTSVEPPDEPGAIMLSKEKMSLVAADIKNMWKRLSLVWGIFFDKDNPDLGYRLRVKEDLPIKLSMRQADGVTVGWRAVILAGCVSEHLYRRSDLENDQYLGGPVSYCNWCPKKQANITLRQISHGSGRYQVRAEIQTPLKPGTELLWNYNAQDKPQFNSGNWFRPECCFIVDKVNKAHVKEKSEVFEERCVLCGSPYRSSSKKSSDRKAQKKVHFMNSHLDYLGSSWDGLGEFDGDLYDIDYNQALLEAERLNRLLQRLHCDSWKVVPACTVMTKKEQTGDCDYVMNMFRAHCARLKRLGCIVLQGRRVPSVVEHLAPITSSRWDQIFPDPSKKPKRVYAMEEADRIGNEKKLQEWNKQDVMMVVNMEHHDGDSCSEKSEDELCESDQ